VRRLPDEEEADPLIGMCVRVNSLDFAARQVADFALQLEGALGIAPGEFLHGAQHHALLLGACSSSTACVGTGPGQEEGASACLCWRWMRSTHASSSSLPALTGSAGARAWSSQATSARSLAPSRS
jgi:hypothetical protein